jgi:hypothetical protein
MDFKNLTIGDAEYRIGKLKAADGSWIYMTSRRKYQEYLALNPSPAQEETEQSKAFALLPEETRNEMGAAMSAEFMAQYLSRTELAEVQRICLGVCGRYSDRTGSPVAMPIMREDGRWAIPELETNGPAVLELTKQCIAFNIAPYFPVAGSSRLETNSAGSMEPNIQP